MTETGGLRLAKLAVESGWSLCRASERYSCSPPTASFPTALVLSASNTRPDRTEDHRVPLHPALGPAPHRPPPSLGPVHRGEVLRRYHAPALTSVASHRGHQKDWAVQRTAADTKWLDVLLGTGTKPVPKPTEPSYAYLHHAVDDHSRLA